MLTRLVVEHFRPFVLFRPSYAPPYFFRPPCPSKSLPWERFRPL